MNYITISGKIKKELKLSYTKEGIMMVSSLFEDLDQKNGAFRIVAFDDEAAKLHAFSTENCIMTITGILQNRKFKSKDGQSQFITEIVVKSHQKQKNQA